MTSVVLADAVAGAVNPANPTADLAAVAARN
jgi:hypothetical protein